ncbi:hypothetical protein, partial [Stenotrophomonas maltophilia]|uniref:hypothetical protein n=1 Tax=Stenotrophomonas maltophilia TaxID=40324 RepID=UPI00195381B0
DSDATRPNFLSNALNNTKRYFSPEAGIGSTGAPYQGSLLSYTRTVISSQSDQADTAKQLNDGQQVVLS